MARVVIEVLADDDADDVLAWLGAVAGFRTVLKYLALFTALYARLAEHQGLRCPDRLREAPPNKRGKCKPRQTRHFDVAKVNPALIGKAGELLVAAELMRRNVQVGYPASDVGIDLLAYRLHQGASVANKFVPTQVKTRSASGYNFQKHWFSRASGLVLVHVWWVSEKLDFYIFQNSYQVEEALGSHANTDSWGVKGSYSVTEATKRHDALMRRHKDKWSRIIDQLPSA